jgi:hypothetical protein
MGPTAAIKPSSERIVAPSVNVSRGEQQMPGFEEATVSTQKGRPIRTDRAALR